LSNVKSSAVNVEWISGHVSLEEPTWKLNEEAPCPSLHLWAKGLLTRIIIYFNDPHSRVRHTLSGSDPPHRR